jgi:integrase
MWTTIRNELQMPDLHFHDLRHEAVSRLVEGGLSDQEVSAISGHKSMQMLKRYTHLRAEDLVGKLDAIGKKIGHRLRLDSLPSPVGDVLQQKA